jgi:hypothetical protein
VLVNAQAKILLLTPTFEGTKHDKKIADEMQLRLPTSSLLYQAYPEGAYAYRILREPRPLGGWLV